MVFQRQLKCVAARPLLWRSEHNLFQSLLWALRLCLCSCYSSLPSALLSSELPISHVLWCKYSTILLSSCRLNYIYFVMSYLGFGKINFGNHHPISKIYLFEMNLIWKPKLWQHFIVTAPSWLLWEQQRSSTPSRVLFCNYSSPTMGLLHVLLHH